MSSRIRGPDISRQTTSHAKHKIKLFNVAGLRDTCPLGDELLSTLKYFYKFTFIVRELVDNSKLRNDNTFLNSHAAIAILIAILNK